MRELESASLEGAVLIIDERIREDGARETVTLDFDHGELVLTVGTESNGLPVDALARVMERYGRPLAPEIALTGTALNVGEGRVLRLLRHRAYYDVIARDFLVWSAPGREPLAELAVTITSALVHLARAARA
jgi:hypothetical protein